MVVIVCMVFLGGEKTYRSVRVLEYQGQANVTRKGETFSVYDDLVIQGGDGMATGEDGQVDLRLDEDKYLVVESSSQVSFDLEGNTEKGAIRINLQEGAVFNSIENPLVEGDSYEIVTPDGVMAVRGTQFRVAVGASPDGNARETRVSVLEGTVHVQLNNHAQDQTSLTAGQEAIIEGDWEQDDACYFQTAGETIDLDTVPEYLKEDVEKVLAQESEVNSETIPSPSPTASSAPTAQPVVTATPAPTPAAAPHRPGKLRLM